MLHEIDETSVYCGPAALMAVTGEPLPVVRAAINKAKGRKHNTGVIGTWPKELLQALETLGFKHYMQEVNGTGFTAHVKTLQQIATNKNWCLPDRTYIVNVTGHYVSVENGIVFDINARFGCPVEEHKCRNKHVKSLIWVYKE